MVFDKLELYAEKQPKLLVAFPGFGMAASISAQYLIDHYNPKLLGHIEIHNPAYYFFAIKGSKIIYPISLFYFEKYNFLLLSSLVPANGFEKTISEQIKLIIEKSRVSQTILLDSIGSLDQKHEVYYFTSDSHINDFVQKQQVQELLVLDEGIVMGLSSLILTKLPNTMGLFAKANIEVPDSFAAAKLVMALDKLYSFDIDYSGLEKASQEFEKQIKEILQKSKTAKTMQDKNQMFYVG